MADKVQYFIGVEQAILLEVGDLTSALYVASFYVFKLEYEAKSFGWFFQDVILGLPDCNRRAASYVAVISDIKARQYTSLLNFIIAASSYSSYC